MLLFIRQYGFHKRIKDMRVTMDHILDGQKKLQIFSNKEDEIGNLAFGINRLAIMYQTAQEKYEKEQLAKSNLYLIYLMMSGHHWFLLLVI
jgi:signal transduction histidine kinase